MPLVVDHEADTSSLALPRIYCPFPGGEWRPPSGTMAVSGVKGSSQVSVKTITLQFLTSCWKAILLLSSSSLLSSDWTLARRILSRGGQFSLFLSLTGTPACDPRFLHGFHSPDMATGNPSHGYSPYSLVMVKKCCPPLTWCAEVVLYHTVW